MPSIALDDFDRAILRLIQQDARLPAEQIGGQVGLSASAIQRRIGRLRKAGIIQAEVAILDAKSVGRPLTVLVELSIDRDRPEHLAELKKWIASKPAIQQAWYITGDADIVLVVTAIDMDEYSALVQLLFDENDNIRKFRTSVVLNTLKHGLSVPIEL
jgi:DNA-binding Lrp family transcriptional regulator